MDKTPIRSLPLIIRKSAILKRNKPKEQSTPNLNLSSLFREDVIHDTTDVYYLKGEFQRLTLVNRMNIVTKVCRTIAKYITKNGSVLEKTSDSVAQIIGQEQYTTVFTALCSTIDQELRIRSILALLTVASPDLKVENVSDIKKEDCDTKEIVRQEVSCQTYETRIEQKRKPRKRIRKPVVPYYVQQEQDVSNNKGVVEVDLKTTNSPAGTIKNSVICERKLDQTITTNVSSPASPIIVNSFTNTSLDTIKTNTPSNGSPDVLNSDLSVTNLDANNITNALSGKLTPISYNSLSNETKIECSINTSNSHCSSASPISIRRVSNLTINSTDGSCTSVTLNGSITNAYINSNVTNIDSLKTVTSASVTSKRKSLDSLPDLGYLQDDCSNDSIGRFSCLSDALELLTNPILNNVDQHTKVDTGGHFKIQVDGMDIVLPHKPEDVFHIATKENLEYLDNKCKLKVLEHQMKIDFRHCLTVLDEDGNLPIHMAVLNDDLELLNRQCVVLKMRQVSVDIRAKGVTALELALHQPSPSSASLSSCLLRAGASPFRAGAGHRTAMHVAAERDPTTLRAVVDACVKNARAILQENESIWGPEMESKPDDDLVKCLMKRLCSLLDQQGYTPLMLASMLGNYENVRLLLEHSPISVNDRMPTSGNTALYLTVAATWNSCTESGNKSKIEDHYRKTIEALLEYYADPNIENHSGTNVNVLLTEFNCSQLSMLISTRRTLANIIKNKAPESIKQFDSLMLLKDSSGNVVYKKLENEQHKKTGKRSRETDQKNKEQEDNKLNKTKPVIVQNILLKSSAPNRSLLKETSKASAGKSSMKTVDESIKASTQDIVITGKSSPVLGDGKKIVLFQTKKNNQNLKRKVVDVPLMLKMAKFKK